MDKINNYDIEFTGLKNGKHIYKFEIEESFFSLFNAEVEFSDPKLTVDVILDKHSNFMEFTIRTHGDVTLECDITSETYQHPMDESLKIIVKQGEFFDDTNEEVITIPHQDYAFNIAQLVYEQIILGIPMKKLSPTISDEDLQLLEKYSPSDDEQEEETETDPRWEALKKLNLNK